MGCGSSTASNAVSTPAPSNKIPETDAEPGTNDELQDKYAEERARYDERIERAMALTKEMHKTLDQLGAASGAATPTLIGQQGTTPRPSMSTIEEFAQTLYNECDHDHNAELDNIELAPLVQLLFDKRPDVAKEFAYNIQKAVADVFRHLGEGEGLSGTLNYVEFVHLLACHPWRSLVPVEMHEDLCRYSESLGASYAVP